MTVVSPAAVVEPDSAVSPSAVVPSGASVAPVSVGSSVADDSAAESCSSVCRQADSTMQPASRHRATASQTARDISLRAVYRCFLMCSSLSNSSGIPLRRGTAGDSPLSAPIIPVYPFNVNRFAHFCAICSSSLRATVYSGEERERRRDVGGFLKEAPKPPRTFLDYGLTGGRVDSDKAGVPPAKPEEPVSRKHSQCRARSIPGDARDEAPCMK